MARSGGWRANKRGQNLKHHMGSLLNEDYQQVSARRFFAARCLEQPIFAEQVQVGTNIYAKSRRVDFMVFHPQRWPDCLCIQCKWQTSAGSVEEKYLFEIECIAQGAFETIIVLEGEGYRNGARQWLLAQRGKRKLIDVCNMGEITRMHTQGRL